MSSVLLIWMCCYLLGVIVMSLAFLYSEYLLLFIYKLRVATYAEYLKVCSLCVDSPPFKLYVKDAGKCDFDYCGNIVILSQVDLYAAQLPIAVFYAISCVKRHYNVVTLFMMSSGILIQVCSLLPRVELNLVSLPFWPILQVIYCLNKFYRKLVSSLIHKFTEYCYVKISQQPEKFQYIDDMSDGVSFSHDVFIKDIDLNHHCLVMGTTGSGKTTTLLKCASSVIARELPLIYVDGKGSYDLIDKLHDLARRHNRKFKLFSLRDTGSPHIAGYNPLSSGGATEWGNRIMGLFAQITGRGQEHFSLAEQHYINFVMHVLAHLNKKVDLRVLVAFLEYPDKLILVANKVDTLMANKLIKLHNDKSAIKLMGDILKMLELFIYSDYGHLFNTLNMQNVIEIKESILAKEVVLFLLDAATYPSDSRRIARMLINDINSSFNAINRFNKCYCIFDEFASYASHGLTNILTLQRSHGLHALIGTQSLAAIKSKDYNSHGLVDELIACCNNFIVHRVNHYEDAEIMSKVVGDSCHGLSRIEPHVLQELQPGEAIIYRKSLAKFALRTKVCASK